MKNTSPHRLPPALNKKPNNFLPGKHSEATSKTYPVADVRRQVPPKEKIVTGTTTKNASSISPTASSFRCEDGRGSLPATILADASITALEQLPSIPPPSFEQKADSLPPFSEEIGQKNVPDNGVAPRDVTTDEPTQELEVITSLPDVDKASTAPVPLPDLPDVLPFDYVFMPDPLSKFIRDISERAQCPPDIVAVAVLVMIAAIIGRQIGIRPMRNDDWMVISNFSGAAVGNSGAIKSPALSEALSPITQLDAKANRAFHEATSKRVVQDEIAKLQQSINRTEARKALKADKSADVSALLKPAEKTPQPRRYLSNSTEFDTITVMTSENPRGPLVKIDNLIRFIKKLEAAGQEEALSFYKAAADGGSPYVIDQIKRGQRISRLLHPSLSILGVINPDELAEYLARQRGGAAGLLHLFSLAVYPNNSPACAPVDRAPDKAARKAVEDLLGRLDNIDPIAIRAETDNSSDVPFLRFAPAAQALFTKLLDDLETHVWSWKEHPAIAAHLSRYKKLIPSLALINHLCDEQTGPVNEAALKRAINFAKYLESHARRIYFAAQPGIDAAKAVLKRLSDGTLLSPFKAREIYRAGWSGLETPAKAQAAISILIDYGHLKLEELSTGGRPTVIYHWIKG